jgi:hypothetical protein
MLKTISILSILLSGFAGGCSSSPTLSGSWSPGADCDNTGYPQDLVKIAAHDPNGFADSVEVGCSEGSFEIAVPEGTKLLTLDFHVVGDSTSRNPTTETLAGPINDDLDLGKVRIWQR